MIPHCSIMMSKIAARKEGIFGVLHQWPESSLDDEDPTPYASVDVPSNEQPISFSDYINSSFAVRWSEKCADISLQKWAFSQPKPWEKYHRREDMVRYSGESGNAEAYCIAQYYFCGRTTFSLSGPLLSALQETAVSLEDIPTELVRLPFPVIFVAMPQEAFPLNGMYLIERDSTLFVGVVKYTGSDDFEYTVMPFEIDLLRGDNLLECISEDEHMETLMACTPLVANIVLYINSGRADLSEPIKGRASKKLDSAKGKAKSEKWLQKMNRVAATEPVVIRVGDNYTPSAGTGTSGWHYTKRFMRRGHWKRQRWARARAKTKMIWIEPYWVGPTLGDRIHGREYSVVMGGE